MGGDTSSKGPEPIFLDLATECDDPTVTQTDTLCMQCMKQGVTRLLLTRLPHFKEVMVSSFACPHCGHSDSSLINTGAVEDRGVRITFKVTEPEDLRRMIVKSDTALVKIPEVELEIPKAKGEITTVEGVVSRAVEGLETEQPYRRQHQPELAGQIDAFLARLRGLLSLEQPFSVQVNDPSGNSHIDCPPERPHDITKEWYDRTPALNEMLGLATKLAQNRLDDVTEEGEDEEEGDNGEEEGGGDRRQEVNCLDGQCEKCGKAVQTRIKLTDIPHFKEVLVMGTACEHCGYRSRLVKAGGGISGRGRRFTLRAGHECDLYRDVLKSDTCSLEVKEWELEVGAGMLGGKFTTVEGLLQDVKAHMASIGFFTGDSVPEERKEKVQKIFDCIDKACSGAPFTLVLDDPAGNSYLQDIFAPDPDPYLTVEDYDRTEEQDETLGITAMKTEGYEDDQ